jgi:hypothetical protein
VSGFIAGAWELGSCGAWMVTAPAEKPAAAAQIRSRGSIRNAAFERHIID